MRDVNLPDLFPVCQELRARVESDPRLAAQWRSLVADLRGVFSSPRSRRLFTPGSWEARVATINHRV